MNVSFWLQADLQPPEIEVRSTPKSGHSEAHAGLPLLTQSGSGSLPSPNQPDQERITVYRDNSGPDSWSDAHCAIIVGDWEEPSGESQLMMRFSAFAATMIASVNFIASSAFAYHGTFGGSGSIGAADRCCPARYGRAWDLGPEEAKDEVQT